ncbi:MAG: hypothetical protein V4714_03815 [Bacteroidota bacterium]
MKRIYLVLVSLLTMGSVQAQLKLSDTPDVFIIEAVTMLNSTKNPAAMAVGKEFEAVWNGKLGAGQKTKAIALSQQMLAKKYKPVPYLKNLFESISLAVNNQHMAAPELDKYLGVTEKVIAQYDSKALSGYLETCKTFFNDRALYRSNFHSLYVSGGKYSFEFKDGLEEAVVEEQPQDKPKEGVKETNKSTTEAKKTEADNWFSELESKPAADPAVDAVMATYQKAEQPAVMGAILKLEGVDLTIFTENDSAKLSNTQGSLRLQDGVFIGKGGKFTWVSAGLPDVFVALKEYNFNTKMPKLSAEGVSLTYPAKLTAPVEGVFEFVSKKRTSASAAQYPRFMSFNNDVSIKDFGENLSYRGGFALAGSHIYSSSVNGKMATISFQKEGKLRFRTYGRRFELGDSLIQAEQVGATIYQGRDSITHPAVKFYYSKPQTLLRLSKAEGGFRNTPYSDTYHKLDINTDVVRWNLKDNFIDFYTLGAKREVPTLFESYDFFNPKRYENLKGLLPFHPLQILMSYSKTKNTDSFYADDLAKAYKQNVNTIRGAMIELMQHGYVVFDMNTGLIKLNRKGAQNVFSYANKKDFDNLLIPSLLNQPTDTLPNATLDLSSNVFTVRGVSRFNLSDSLRVFVTPRNREIKLLQNRYFLLEGEIAVGNFKFRGKDFYFNYEEFSVTMPTIDSITFISAESQLKNDKTESGGEIRYESGTLFINRADNKSGKKNLPEFPRLSVTSGGAIYFDFNQSDRLKGTYNKNVYFKIPTIDLDSLNNKDPDFVGTFHSDGIFPSFDEKLEAMPDKSLGFRHKVPKGVYPLYRGAATVKFSGPLEMSKTGLRAPGQLEYLTTTLKSNDFLFMPDSTTAKGASGEIKEGAAGKGVFPSVAIKNYSLKWMPKSDSMIINSVKTPFEMYKGSTTMEGSLIVQSTGLVGRGAIKRKDSETYSEKFVLGKDKFTAKEAEFRVSSTVKGKPAILGTTVEVDFDIANSKVHIATGGNSLTDASSLAFPYANYKTNIDHADWDISKKMVTMTGDVNNSVFTSTDSTQEGLSFNGSSAIYDVSKLTLNIGGVPYITTADARIIPHEGKVTILENAEMQPLKKAKLQIDTLNSYHNLIDGTVQVLSKSKFTGNATYQYVNVLSDTFNIKFGNFESRLLTGQKKKGKPAFYTVAEGKVEEADKFFVSSRILFKGTMTMLAPEQNLHLDGFIKPELKSRPDLGSWLTYKSNKTENVVITVDEKLVSEGVPVYSGLHFDRATSDLYPTFLSPKHNPDDENAFLSKGMLHYNASINQFKIAPAEKDAGVSYDGGSLMFDDAKGVMSLEGKLNIFGSVPNEYLLASGSGTLDFTQKTANFNTLLVFNFALPPQALTTMANKILTTEEEEKLEPKVAAEDENALLLKMGPLIGNGPTQQYKSKAELEHVPLFLASRKLLTSLVLSNVDLQWSDKQKAFYSVGKIGVSNIANQDINMQMDGVVEIRKRPTGDEAVIYLELTPDLWYYWSFQQGQLSLLSSDDEFNTMITAKAKGKSKPGQYAFFPADGMEKETTLESFLSNYKTAGAKPFVAKKVEKKIAEPEPTETIEEQSPDEPMDEVAEKPNKKDKKKEKKSKKDRNKEILEEPTDETEAIETPADEKTEQPAEKKQPAVVEKPAKKEDLIKKEETKEPAKTGKKEKKEKKKPVPEEEEEEKDGF